MIKDLKFVYFHNDTLLPLEAVKTMGINAKESENAIGYFGTGLKYAIAVLLRNKHEISLFLDGERHSFGVRRTTIRGKDFDIVTLNGEDLGFTTELGKNWEIWMAFRELYSNCMDEHGTFGEGYKTPKEGTLIQVVGKEFFDVYENFEEFFIYRDDLSYDYQLEDFDIWDLDETESYGHKYIFYKGIRAGELPKGSLFRYDISSKQSLTEDRTLAQPWWIRYLLAKNVVQAADKKYIEKILLAHSDFWESDLDFSSVTLTEPSRQFVEVLKSLLTSTRLNKTATKYYRHWFYQSEMTAVSFSTERSDSIAKAQNILAVGKYPVLQYEIRFFESDGEKLVIGKDDAIFLCQTLREKTPLEVARYLLLGHLQLTGDYSSGDFETFLLDEIVRICAGDKNEG